MKLDKSVLRISAALREAKDSGKDVLILIEFDPEKNYFIQVIMKVQENTLYAECVSNNFLKKRDQLDYKKKLHMQEIGWEIDRKNPEANYQITLSTDTKADIRNIACFFVETMRDIYYVDTVDFLNIDIQMLNKEDEILLQSNEVIPQPPSSFRYLLSKKLRGVGTTFTNLADKILQA